MTRKLSEHFTLEEFTASQTAARKGIDNTPDAAALRNLSRLAATLEVVRAALGHKPIVVSSGYRCPALNTAIGGAKGSFHTKGLAVDFTVKDFGTVLATARAIARLDIPRDQIIYEYGRWIHLGLAEDDDDARGELWSIGSAGKYVSGLTSNC
ncbi:hypothetical protein BurJ1DRAFT_2828 [Burkholderiales bacterium JOSHI_001]|nr:hypothetical protein BurJ1DRAFT_2828 [Burkholderiales bacterium JOSHI_001]